MVTVICRQNAGFAWQIVARWYDAATKRKGRSDMTQEQPNQVTYFSQPIRQIVTMLLALALIGAGAWLIRAIVLEIMLANLWLNGAIVGVFLIGVVACFWQVFVLGQSVRWIESFVRGNGMISQPPQLLAPLAQSLGGRSVHTQISSSAARSILDAIASRIDEARDITRYLTNLLVFLGLLGTFYGLATTVPAIVDTIRNLAPQEGETGLDVFGKLMGGLESQLGGMGTAFSSSLLGLAGSLVIGLLELFAGHGQNRFYRELEEWMSTITRLGVASNEGEGGIAEVIDHLAGQIEVLQTVLAQTAANAEATRQGFEAGMAQLTHSIKTLSGEGDAEARMRLRSIDVQLLKILEEMSAGRHEATAALTTAIRQLRAPNGKP